MKKLFFSFMTLTLAFSLVFTSCKKDEEENNGATDPEQEQTDPTTEDDLAGYTQLTAAEGTAYPTYSYIDIQFTNDDDETIVISFNVEEGAETLPVGTYTYDEDGEYAAGTFDPEYSYYGDDIYFSDGTVTVTKAGKKYTVKFDLVTEDDDTLKYYYQGSIDLDVYTFDPQTEYTFTWDDIDTDWTYYAYSDAISMYVTYITLVDATTSWEIDLCVVNTTDPAGSLIDGDYSMLTTSYADFGIVPGYSSDGYIEGSYATDWSSGYGYFSAGSMTIATADGNTTLEGTFTDTTGNEYVVSASGATPTIELYTSGAPGLNGNTRPAMGQRVFTGRIARK